MVRTFPYVNRPRGNSKIDLFLGSKVTLMCQMSSCIDPQLERLNDCDRSDINIWSNKGKIPISKSHRPRFVFPFLILLYTQMSKMSCSFLSFWCPANERVQKPLFATPLKKSPRIFFVSGSASMLDPSIHRGCPPERPKSSFKMAKCRLPSFCHRPGCRHKQSCSSSQKGFSSP